MKKLTLLAVALGWGLGVSQALHASDTDVSPRFATEPRFNEVFRNATHNSYWVHRSAMWDPFASGVQERLMDQLLFDRVRALEIDIHKSRSKVRDWRVYHTDVQGDSFCTPLDECLKQLEQFHYAVPNHEPVVIVLELKEILDYNFDSNHTPADLDRLLERRLGPYLYRPRDFVARCAPGATMRQCAAQVGWPTVRELRGKFIFAVLGNWRYCTIGHGPSGWATYATWRTPGTEASGPAVNDRSAFPMQSDWGDWSKDTCGNEGIPAAERDQAMEASIFLQVESLGSTGHTLDIPAFLGAGGIVRADGPPDLGSQATSIRQGFQMYQLDYPWFQERTPEWTEVFHAFRQEDFLHPILAEPGDRLAMLADKEGAQLTFVPARTPSASGARYDDWETVVSSTRSSPDKNYPNRHHPKGQGCLRAESEDGRQAFSVCRHTTLDTANPLKVPGQNAAITVEVQRHGLLAHKRSFYSGNNRSNGVGDHIRMLSFTDSSGSTCVSAFSSSELRDGAPVWTPLYSYCFGVGLARQGIAASQGDALFVHTKRNGTPVRGADLTPDSGSQYDLRDYSVE